MTLTASWVYLFCITSCGSRSDWLMKANGVYLFLELCSYKTREHNLFWQISTIQCCPNQDQGRTCFHQIYMTSFQEFWKCNIFRCSNMSAGDDDSQSESVYTIKTTNTLSRQGSEGHEWITSHPFNDNQAYVKVSYFWWCGGGILGSKHYIVLLVKNMHGSAKPPACKHCRW